MHKATHPFFLSTALGAAFLVYVLPLEQLTTLSWSDWAGLAAFAAVALYSERLAIDFGTGKQASTSVAFLPFIACALLFGSAPATVVVAVTVTTSSVLVSRLSPWKTVFNVSQAVLSIALAASIYDKWFAAEPFEQSAQQIDILGAFCLAIAFFTTNIVLSSVAISLLRQLPLREVVRHVTGPRGGNLWYDLLATPIAIVQALLFRDYHVLGIAMILLPLLLVRYSYLSKMQLEEANRDLLKVLVKAIETRDPYTSGHSLRVATLARSIALAMQLPSQRVEDIETAALLHDIGKIDLIFEGLLRKPHQLSESEREIIRTHAAKGAELLESLNSVPRTVIIGVRHHHERFDGTGYPDGLAGAEIPLSARIIMLCDSIDAMLSDRPYRKALPIQAVYAEIERCAGSQFDPEVVSVIVTHNVLAQAAELTKAPEDGQETSSRRRLALQGA